MFWSFEIETNEEILQILLSDSSMGEDIAKAIEDFKAIVSSNKISKKAFKNTE
ncbi:hypothetical protein LEP1GSC051_0435 [Leptospira sp. P2653]|nr:hypothetical protein LEP1GSC051_0435 [Leptospira sp. P2653]